jgi:hypothetical protein
MEERPPAMELQIYLINTVDKRQGVVLQLGRLGVGLVQNLLSSHLLPKNVEIRIYKTIILPVALYGCDTWSLTLTEEHRLRVFENRVLRRIFGPKKDDVTGERKKTA